MQSTTQDHAARKSTADFGKPVWFSYRRDGFSWRYTIPLYTLLITSGPSPDMDDFPPSRLNPSPAEVFSTSTHRASWAAPFLPAARMHVCQGKKTTDCLFNMPPIQCPSNAPWTLVIPESCLLASVSNLWSQHQGWPSRREPGCVLLDSTLAFCTFLQAQRTLSLSGWSARRQTALVKPRFW